jgi:hypothetical protein
MDAGRRALLAHIATVRDQAVADLIGRAEQESAEIISRARRQARAQVHAALGDERHRRNSARQRAWGDMHAAVRQAQYRRMQKLLDEALVVLRDQLLVLWNDATHRRSWLETLMAAALKHMDQTRWTIEHPARWDRSEAGQPLRELAGRRANVNVQFRIADDIDAGFRLLGDHVTFDATLTGLFDDGGRIKGALLGMLVRMPGWPDDVAFEEPESGTDTDGA